MRLGTSARALPVLFKVGFSEAVAYRAELAVWILSSTMPLIMLALWTAVALDGPVGRFTGEGFTAYFLGTFIVRQLTGSWVSWEMNYEIRHGTLSARLLRPLHPMLAYAVESLAAMPLRLAVALPVALLALVFVGGDTLPHDPLVWAIWVVAILGAWLMTFLAGFCIGCLAFALDSSVKIVELWLVLFLVFSGYLIPVELFPGWLRTVADALPFRYQIGFPVELLTAGHTRFEALGMLGRQALWVTALFVLASTLWRRGLARFAAFGG